MKIAALSWRENQRLRRWLDAVRAKASWLECDDIHIDEIGDRFKKPINWMEGALACYSAANEMIFNLDPEISVQCGFSLSGTIPDPSEVVARPRVIAELLDDSPPSLYLFPKTFDIWNGWLKRKVVLKGSEWSLPSLPPDSQWVYYEYVSKHTGGTGQSLFIEPSENATASDRGRTSSRATNDR